MEYNRIEGLSDHNLMEADVMAGIRAYLREKTAPDAADRWQLDETGIAEIEYKALGVFNAVFSTEAMQKADLGDIISVLREKAEILRAEVGESAFSNPESVSVGDLMATEAVIAAVEKYADEVSPASSVAA